MLRQLPSLFQEVISVLELRPPIVVGPRPGDHIAVVGFHGDVCVQDTYRQQPTTLRSVYSM